MSRINLDCRSTLCGSPERTTGGQRTNGGCRCEPLSLAQAQERAAEKAWGKVDTHTPCSGCQRHTLTASMPHGRCAACDATFEAGRDAGVVGGLIRAAVHLESLATSQEHAAWEAAQRKGMDDFVRAHEATAKAYRAGAESLREQAKWAGEP